VLSNDSAGAGDSLIVKDVTGSGSATAVAASGTTNIAGSYGTLTIAANGSYSYAVDQTNATVQALNVSSTGLIEVFRGQADIGLTRIERVVDECRKSGSLSEKLMTILTEAGRGDAVSRITAEDCFIPLGPAAELVLPSKASIIEAARAAVA
jgi:VCBS repeat-containing protein